MSSSSIEAKKPGSAASLDRSKRCETSPSVSENPSSRAKRPQPSCSGQARTASILIFTRMAARPGLACLIFGHLVIPGEIVPREGWNSSFRCQPTVAEIWLDPLTYGCPRWFSFADRVDGKASANDCSRAECMKQDLT